MIHAECNDATLVAASLGGDRNAFSQIVTRYQSLVCSLAYSATGSLSRSEDLAQETFVIAWRELAALREPEKLRSWICGIARRVVANTLRREMREPVRQAESLDAVAETPAAEPCPVEHTISHEEESILWRSISEIPDTYREPLVLFYRQGESIERVAEMLGLTEDAVKQRLSRGRKLLQENVASFVEGALKQSNPGRKFTFGVMAAIPGFGSSTLAVAAGKGGVAAKAGLSLSGWLLMLAGPVLALVGTWIGFKISLESARTEEMRVFITKFYRILIGVLLGGFVLFGATFGIGLSAYKTHPTAVIAAAVVEIVLFLGVSLGLAIWASVRQKALSEKSEKAGMVAKPTFEYRSKAMFLGLPLIHVRAGCNGRSRAGMVKGWIAVGDSALGGLFALGGFAVAPISFGGFGIGLVTFSGFGLGILSVAGLALGVWAVGGQAVGWDAIGACAVGWSTAMGSLAVAHDYALGFIAIAGQTDAETVRKVTGSSMFFTWALKSLPYFPWLNLIWLAPVVWWWRRNSKSQHPTSSE